jgi:RNA polymerase sigma-70 factor (ECF subfamily)
MPDPHGPVTALLARMKLGHKEALAELMPLVYGELRGIARRQLREERACHTLQPTALVHEAYLRLVGQDQADYQSRGHFLAVAAQMMRRILVNYAERRAAGKRAGNRVTLDEERLAQDGVHLDEILAVNEALERLARLDPRQAKVAEMRYFAGLSVEETAQALGVSPRTVKRDWAIAKGWIQTQWRPGSSPDEQQP